MLDTDHVHEAPRHVDDAPDGPALGVGAHARGEINALFMAGSLASADMMAG